MNTTVIRTGFQGLTWVFGISLLTLSLEASAQVESMFPRRGRHFTAPHDLFAVTIPANWQVALIDGDPTTVQFRAPDHPGHPSLYIRQLRVPQGAKPRQLRLNALEHRLEKLPQFRVLQKRDIRLAGHPAATILANYDFQGNAQYPRIVEEIYMVANTVAYVFHFECAEPAAAGYAADLTTFYTSFKPRSAARLGARSTANQEQIVNGSKRPF